MTEKEKDEILKNIREMYPEMCLSVEEMKDRKIKQLECTIKQLEAENFLLKHASPVMTVPKSLIGKISVGPCCCWCGRPGEVRYY